jgi:chitinase
VVVGYVFPQNAVLGPGQFGQRNLDRINYAFAAVKDGQMVTGAQSDAENLAQLTALRKQDPSLTVLISVGGWLGSGGFSDVALTAQSRKDFIGSVMECLRHDDFDGLDVDWEYPGQTGAGNRFRRADKQNFTLLLDGLREQFDREATTSHKKLYLTIAAGASPDYLAHTEMAMVQKYVDAVNLMTYEYYEPGADALTGNHAPLFTDPNDGKNDSADTSVAEFESAGVPAACSEELLFGATSKTPRGNCCERLTNHCGRKRRSTPAPNDPRS